MMTQASVQAMARVWVLLLAAALLIQVSAGSLEEGSWYGNRPAKKWHFRLWPGTHREFVEYECNAEFHKDNREVYKALIAVCDDCQNHSRLPGHRHYCMQNCFDNEHFKDCTETLLYSTEDFNGFKEMMMQLKV